MNKTASGRRAGISRRRIIGTPAQAIVGGAAVGLLGAACGVSGGGGTQDAGGSAAPPAGVRSGVTVSFYHGGQQAESDARTELLKAFGAKYPQLKLEHLYTPQQTGAKLDALLSAGTPPDIFYVANGADVTTRAARGSLQELGPLARRDKFDTSDMFESAVALYQFCGKQYAYPLDFPNQAVYYNIDLFEQAGVKPPPVNWSDDTWTFDRFLDAAKRLTKETGGGTQWATSRGIAPFATGGCG